MRRALRGSFASAALATFALLAGCLDFDEQEIRVVYDAGRDRIDAQLVYIGLHSSGKLELFGTPPEERDDVEGTERQLDQLLAGWPLVALFDAVYLTDLVELRRSNDALRASLAEAITVDQGAPFKDAEGRLCGWQHLRVRDVHHVFEILDEMLRAKLADAKEELDFRRKLGCTSKVSATLWKAALDAKSRWFESVDGALIWHVPASEGDARALAKSIEAAPTLERYLERHREREPSDAPAAPAAGGVVRESEVALRGVEGLLVLLHSFGVEPRLTARGVDLVLWDPKRSPQVVRVPATFVNDWRFDLLPYLEKRHVDIRTDVTSDSLRRDFDERRAR